MADKENQTQNSIKTRDYREETIKRKNILDNAQLCALRKIIYKIYTVDKEIPTLNGILVAAKQQLNYNGSKTLLRKLLSEKLFIKFKKCKINGPLPMERQKSILNRCDFLRFLLDNEAQGPNKRNVIYFDEILLNSENGKLGKWYIFQAGDEKGFIKNSRLFQNLESKSKITKKQAKTMFMNWLKTLLIPNLPSNSIVIFDDDTQHNRLIGIIPDVMSPKEKIKDWLKMHNIEFAEDMSRPELLSLVKENKPVNNYEADYLIESAGHKALRLPPYTDLNPMEKILLKVKDKVKEFGSNKSERGFEDIVCETLSSICNDDWQNEIKRVNNLTKEYMEMEALLDDETDKLEINIEESENDIFSSDTDDYLTDFSYDISDTSEDSDCSEEYEDMSYQSDTDEDNNSYSV